MEHLATLRELFTMVRKAELTIWPPKCCLGYSSLEFVGHTVGSDRIAVGVVLLQELPDGLFPFLHASKKLLSCETNYSVIEKECLALMFAVRKFQKYLYRDEFVLQTNHKPLAYIQHCKIDSAKIMCWTLYLQNYRLRNQSIKWTGNVRADCISRLCN